jgi:hypothetical protein
MVWLNYRRGGRGAGVGCKSSSASPRVYPLRTRVYSMRSRVYPLRTRVYSMRSRVYPLRTRVYSMRSRVYPLRTRVYSVRVREGKTEGELPFAPTFLLTRVHRLGSLQARRSRFSALTPSPSPTACSLHDSFCDPLLEVPPASRGNRCLVPLAKRGEPKGGGQNLPHFRLALKTVVF